MANIQVTTHYPISDEYEYETRLERFDLDEERRSDVTSGKGFIISSAKPIKDDVKDPNGIFSNKFGMTLQDIQPFANRYRCKCGAVQSAFMQGQECPICHTPVKFVDDDFKFFGWIVLKDIYHLIHPTLYMSLAAFIGDENLNNIIKIQAKKDEDGNDIEVKKPKNEPFFGIGMMEFYNKFDEVMEFYKNKAKSQSKIELYEDLMSQKDIIFTHSIPVFTTMLRPYRIENAEMHYEGTNAIYKMCATLAYRINDDSLRMTTKSKNKNELLYDLQMKYKALFDEINKILSGKKGSLRQLFGGRFNFSARSVIVPDPTLRSDQIRLSYPCLCGLLQQRIISVLKRSHNMQYHEAFIYLDQHCDDHDPLITAIINGFIKNDCEGKGIPVLVNRNPTIGIGGIIQCYIIGISDGFTMTMPLTVLKGLAADFDGDTLNILLIINEDFRRAAENVLNPCNSMLISKNDGMFNADYNHQRDTIINANTMLQLSRQYYSKDQIDRIKACKYSYN